jgi:esterase
MIAKLLDREPQPLGEERRIQQAGAAIVYQWLDAPARDCAVVCLHGVASNATRFYEWMSHSALRGRCALLALDQRGHGRSLTYRAFQRADWCADLAAIFAQEKVHGVIVGHSMGAQVALDYASGIKHGARGLILIDPVFPQALSGVLKTVARWRRPLRLGIGLLRFFNRLGLHRRHYQYRSLSQLDVATRAYLAANPHKDIASLYMDPFADLEFMPLVNYLQDLYEVTRPLADLAAIAIPVLVLLSKGASTSDVAHNQRILAVIRHCEIQVIDADHWLLTEQPEAARVAIDAWVTRTLHLNT